MGYKQRKETGRPTTNKDMEVYVCFYLPNATDEQLAAADAVHARSPDKSPMWQLEKTFEKQLGVEFGDYQMEYYLNVIDRTKEQEEADRKLELDRIEGNRKWFGDEESDIQLKELEEAETKK